MKLCLTVVVHYVNLLPATYPDFVSQLKEACNQGDIDSQNVISKLAPRMAAFL